jgi:glucose/mannose-6-phosphate isomerase
VSRDPDAGLLEPPYETRDAGGMAARIGAIPRQIEDAMARAGDEPWRLPGADPDLVAVGGLGGSAIAADLTAGLYADRLPHPLLVVRDYRWPACVTKRSLAVLSSCSGDTEETLALYRDAGERGIPRVVLTRGGTLAARARGEGVHVQPLSGEGPPRAALFIGWVPLTGLLHHLGWTGDPAPGWREAAEVARRQDAALGPGAPPPDNPAKQLALALHGRLVFIYSGSERLGAVGLRWRQQLNENAKLLGHSAVVPELNHNEIVGWERPGPVHDRAAVVVLRDAEDTPEVEARLTLTADFATRRGATVHEVTGRGEHRLARLASLVQFGDYVSFYLALLGGTDPTPIASIDEFKRRLAAPGRSHAG